MFTLFTIHTSHFTLHTSHFTLNTSHFTLNTKYCTLVTSYCTLVTSYCTLVTSNITLSSLTSPKALHTEHFTLNNKYCLILDALYCTLLTSHITLSTPHWNFTQNKIHWRFHTALWTLLSAHCTLHTPQYTLHTADVTRYRSGDLTLHCSSQCYISGCTLYTAIWVLHYKLTQMEWPVLQSPRREWPKHFLGQTWSCSRSPASNLRGQVRHTLSWYRYSKFNFFRRA